MVTFYFHGHKSQTNFHFLPFLSLKIYYFIFLKKDLTDDNASDVVPIKTNFPLLIYIGGYSELI